MTMLASQITSLTVVYSIVYSGVNQRKHQSSASLAFVCMGNSPGTGEFPAQMASYAENVSIWWRHHELSLSALYVLFVGQCWNFFARITTTVFNYRKKFWHRHELCHETSAGGFIINLNHCHVVYQQSREKLKTKSMAGNSFKVFRSKIVAIYNIDDWVSITFLAPVSFVIIMNYPQIMDVRS